MSAVARIMPVVAMLLAALVDASLHTRPVLAEDSCLTAPNARAPQGSHWYYRTDPVKQSKCWYLRTEGPVTQKHAAQKTIETNIGVEGLAATPSKTAPDQLAPAPLELRPGQAVQASSADKPTKMNIPNNAQPNRQAATARAWPNPPVPAAAAKVAWPDPPAPTAVAKVAWPDPPSPDLSSPLRGGAREVGAENTPAATRTPEEEEGKHTREVPTNSIEGTGNDVESNRYIAEPKTWLVGQKEMPMSMLLAFGIGLVIAGLVVRRVVRVVFARRPTVKRREAALSTGVASQRTLPTHGDLAPESDAAVHLDNNAKESLRKLLKVLEQQTA